ncbi:MAG TPA: PF20097 family protein [Ruminiclostridium sp.]
MRCPYCNKDMKQGVIQSPYQISWLPKKAKLFTAAELHEGAIILSERSFLKGSCVKAYCCDGCKKVIIDYGDTNSD